MPPPTVGPIGRFLTKFNRKPPYQPLSSSTSPSPSLGIERCNRTGADQPIKTPSGGNVTAVSSAGHGSPLPSMPITQILNPQSEPIASGNSASPSTWATHIPTITCQGEDLAKTGAAGQPLTKSTMGLDIIEPSSHSSALWAKALDIANQKLSENNLPPVDITNHKFPALSAEESINAVIKGLNTLQQDDKKKRWTYTWHGKEVIVMERVAKILKSVEKFSKIGDTLVQVNPQVGAFVWAGVWSIMRVRSLWALLPSKTVC